MIVPRLSLHRAIDQWPGYRHCFSGPKFQQSCFLRRSSIGSLAFYCYWTNCCVHPTCFQCAAILTIPNPITLYRFVDANQPFIEREKRYKRFISINKYLVRWLGFDWNCYGKQSTQAIVVHFYTSHSFPDETFRQFPRQYACVHVCTDASYCWVQCCSASLLSTFLYFFSISLSDSWRNCKPVFDR